MAGSLKGIWIVELKGGYMLHLLLHLSYRWGAYILELSLMAEVDFKQVEFYCKTVRLLKFDLV